MPQPSVGGKNMGGINWSPLWKLEDWWAVWFGLIGIFLAATGTVSQIPKFKTWTVIGEGIPQGIGLQLLGLLIGLSLITAIGIKFMGQDPGKYLLALPVVFILGAGAQFLAANATAKSFNLETALWGLVLGLAISNFFKTPQWLKPAVKTELYIKTGLVFLGCEILFNRIIALGMPGLIVAWVVTPIVVLVMFWFGDKILKMESKELNITLTCATSVCGVSAAIAAGAASGAKKDEVSIAITISLLFTVIMMVAMPAFILFTGLDPDVGAAWMGGTIDSTGAVVAAGAILGQRGLEISSIVKMIQNVLIGIIAFIIAMFWIAKLGKKENGKAASPKEIWNRFPKFILGFVGTSLLFSFVFMPTVGEEMVNSYLSITKELRGWLFAMAFVSIGLDSNFKELASHIKGGKPVIQYLVGQSFNIILTFIVAWLCFGGILFPKVF